MIKFVLCDDNFAVLQKLEKMLELIITKHNFPAEIGLSTVNYEEFLDYIETNPVDVLFLDINLKAPLTGLELARQS
ncbi:MAG: hypothetical protein Q4G05_05085 [Clostridia bacterium]|nr:hypothetical protein [Clostridia bacterium]